MKFLRVIFIGLVLLCSQYKLYAIYFIVSEIKITETSALVTVRPDLTQISPSLYCKWKFKWQYNEYDYSKVITKEVAPADIYSYSETFVYPLNDQFINSGMFGAGINLELTMYYSDGANCLELSSGTDYQYAQKDLGTTTILATLDYSPKYPDGLPKNTAINFNFIFTPGSNANLDHLTYTILINNSAIFQGGAISQYDFGQLKSWTYNSGFPNPLTYTAQVQVKRFGLVVGLSDPISISVKADPAPPQPPIPQCVSGLNPALQVDAVVNNDKIDLTFKDISSSTFTTTFGGKSKYSLLVTDADNIGYTVAGGTSINDHIYYPAGGFITLSRTYNLSSIIKPSYTFTINFLTQCKDASGIIQTRSDLKTIGVPGKPFTQEENNVNVPPEGKLNQTVDIRAGYCKTLLIDQPDSQLGNGNWVTNINLSGNFLTFDVAPNNSTVERNLGIKVFVNGYYDPCLAIEDGFTKTYRNIEVTQASKFKDISNNPGELMPLPNMTVNPSVIYYSTQDYSSTKISGYFLKDFPLQLATWNGMTQVSSNIIKGYDVNNKVVWQTTLTIIKWTCNDISSGSFDVSFLGSTNNYFGYVVHTPDKVDFIGAYEKGVIIVTSEKQITFKPGFQAKTGAILNASIQPCSTLKSALLKKDTTQSKINNLTANFIDPQGAQEEKLVQSVSQVSIYPNPNEGKFSIDMNNLKETVVRIEIYNSAGTIQKILNNGIKPIETIDLNKAAADTYFIKIISEKSIYNYKIIKL